MNRDWVPNSTYPPSAALTAQNLESSAYSDLPKEPGAYEDFNYHHEFEFPDLFDTTPTARTPLGLSPFNPFDPAHLGFPEPFSPTAAYMPQPSTSSLPRPPEPPSGLPAPLLDEGESALFSNFLAGVGGDPNFLFDPVLPPGMPSPPSELVRGETREERRERDRLGEEVRSLTLAAGWQHQPQAGPSSAGPRDEVQFARPPAPQAIRNEFSASPPEASYSHDGSTSRTRGTTRANEEQATGGRGNKLHKSTHQNLEQEEDEDEGDTLMKEEEDESATTRRRPSRGAANSRRRHASVVRPNQPPMGPPSQTPASIPVVASSMVRPRSNSSSSVGDKASVAGGEKRAPLTESEKRQNHILSEQRRRNQIKVGFASLVDLLTAGEEASGISIKSPPEDDAKGKKKGRGRGRKGDVGGGASKSVVLQKAARYLVWLERGNDAIEDEIRRVEGLLGEL